MAEEPVELLVSLLISGRRDLLVLRRRVQDGLGVLVVLALEVAGWFIQQKLAVSASKTPYAGARRRRAARRPRLAARGRSCLLLLMLPAPQKHDAARVRRSAFLTRQRPSRP